MKTFKKNLSHGTVPLKLVIMIDSDTNYKHRYVVVGVTVPFKGPQRGLSKTMLYFTFDSWVGKLIKNLCLMVLPH